MDDLKTTLASASEDGEVTSSTLLTSNDTHGLPVWKIVVIAIGSLLLFFVVLGGFYFCYRCTKKKPYEDIPVGQSTSESPSPDRRNNSSDTTAPLKNGFKSDPPFFDDQNGVHFDGAK